MKSSALLLAGCMAMSAGLVSCGAGHTVSGEIVATNSVLASVVRMLTGDQVRVVAIVPDGKDPHEFQPSAGDIARIANAKLVVSNGFGYEPSLDRAVSQARVNGVPVLDVERDVPVLHDAHWFTDPLSAVQVLAALKPVMEEATGLGLDDEFSAAEENLRATVTQASDELSRVPAGECRFAVEHILLAPFSARFSCPGDVVLNAGSRVPDAQPSARDIERFAAGLTENRIRAVVEDAAEPSRVLGQVAQQTGATLVRVDVHGLGGALTYRDYVTNIAVALAGALS